MARDGGLSLDGVPGCNGRPCLPYRRLRRRDVHKLIHADDFALCKMPGAVSRPGAIRLRNETICAKFNSRSTRACAFVCIEPEGAAAPQLSAVELSSEA